MKPSPENGTNVGFLKANTDSQLDMIQVFKSVRNEKGEIIDFIWVLNDLTAEKLYGNVVGKSLLETNPDEGVFETLKKVVETGIPDKSERHYVYEDFDGWLMQLTVKLNDGVATTTTDITDLKKETQRVSEELKAFLVTLGDILRPLTDLTSICKEASRLLGEHLGSDRVLFCLIHEHGEITNINGYHAADVEDISGRRKIKDFAGGSLEAVMSDEKIVNDTQIDPQIRAYIGIPIIRSGKTIAAVIVQQATPRTWRESEVIMTRVMAERTWAAIERARAEEAILISDDRMRALKETYQSVVNGSKLEDSLSRLSKLVVDETLGDARTAFYTISEDRRVLHPIFGSGTISESYLKEIDNFPVGEDSLACGLAISEGKRVITPDVYEDPLWKPWTHLAEKYEYRGCWSFPIITRDEQAIGTFAMYFKTRRAPSERDLSLVDIVTRTAAVVISNYSANVNRTKAERLLKEANSQLKEMDEAKTDFFNNVSHEFRTPLTLLIGPLEEVIKKTPSKIPADDINKLQIAYRGAIRLQKLVNTLLDFARIEAGKLEAFYQPTDFSKVTIDLAANFRSAIEKAGLKFVVKSEPINEAIYLNREMWEKIVSNLLSNAFKFTHKGKIEVILRNKKKNVELRVKDSGIGIAPKNINRIFERFVRIEGKQARTFEGTGIGLALVRELVSANGGNIKVKSVENAGSEFIVSIPKGKDHLPRQQIYETRENLNNEILSEPFVEEVSGWRPEDEKLAKRKLKKYNREGALRVLIAEDNADMRDYLTSILSEDKYEIHAVEDGQKALTFLRQGGQADIILADVMMPNVDGYDLVQWLKSDPRFSNIPIVLVSARASEESKIEGLKMGADDYLVKPFSAKELRAVVMSRIKQGQKNRSLERT